MWGVLELVVRADAGAQRAQAREFRLAEIFAAEEGRTGLVQRGDVSLNTMDERPVLQIAADISTTCLFILTSSLQTETKKARPF